MDGFYDLGKDWEWVEGLWVICFLCNHEDMNHCRC